MRSYRAGRWRLSACGIRTTGRERNSNQLKIVCCKLQALGEVECMFRLLDNKLEVSYLDWMPHVPDHCLFMYA